MKNSKPEDVEFGVNKTYYFSGRAVDLMYEPVTCYCGKVTPVSIINKGPFKGELVKPAKHKIKKTCSEECKLSKKAWMMREIHAKKSKTENGVAVLPHHQTWGTWQKKIVFIEQCNIGPVEEFLSQKI